MTDDVTPTDERADSMSTTPSAQVASGSANRSRQAQWRRRSTKAFVAGALLVALVVIPTAASSQQGGSAMCVTTITGRWLGSFGTPGAPTGAAIEMDISKPSWTNELTADITQPFFQTVKATVQCNTWTGPNYTGTINDAATQITGMSPIGPYFLNRQPDPAVTVSVQAAEVTEPDPGGSVDLQFPVVLSRPLATDATVTYRVVALTTTSQDARDNGFGQPKTVTFKAGTALQKTIAVRVWGDSQIETNEQIRIDILSTTVPGGAGSNSALGTIIDNDKQS